MRKNRFDRKIDSIVLHHSETKYDTLKTIKRYHTEKRGWSDIGYHYVIELAGEIKDGRPILEKGAHCISKNSTSIGICLIGIDKFSKDQIKSLKWLLIFLTEIYDIPNTKIFGHNEFSSKKCPGFDVGLIREMLK